MNTAIDYRKELNPEQYRVVSEGDGYCLVLAGAGSGKTHTLVYRVAYLLDQGVRPEEILLVTFTIKASREMLSRVETLLGRPLEGIWGGTFHHICNRILRKFSPRLGVPQNYIIVDEEDARALFSQVIRDVVPQDLRKSFPSPGFFSYLRGLAVNTMRPWEDLLRERFSEYADHFFLIGHVFDEYRKRKREADVLDFDDLLVMAYRLLNEHPDVRDYYSRKFRYVLVDEYQDTSRLQARFVEVLASTHKNLLVVGDDAQSIYSFRGASVENILEFTDRHPSARVFFLNTNYRSTPEVLYLANSSIENNFRGYQKRLKAVQGEGELPIVARFSSAEEESAFIAQQIEFFLDEGVSPSQIAVLFRTTYHSAKLELALAHRGIDYVMRGGMRFFEQAHIKDVLAYLRVLYNPKDHMAWQRILCMYPGIGPQTAKRLYLILRDVDLSNLGNLEGRWSAKVKTAWEKIRYVFSAIQGLSAYEACKLILDSGYWDYLRENFEDYTSRQEDLIYLLDFLKGYRDLESLFSDIGLSENFKRPQRESSDAVVLSTVHQAKGLEWEVVFVMGVVDGQFPHSKSFREENGIEEERRLFYVALTRAKRHLIITAPTMSFDYRFGGYFTRRSSFIEELPRDGYRELSPLPIDG